MGIRTRLVVPVVLALVAPALTPAIGQAETSSEITYFEGTPGLKSVPPSEKKRSKAPSRDHPKRVHPAPAETHPTTVEPEANESRHPGAVAPSGAGKPPQGGAGGRGPTQGGDGNRGPRQTDPPKASPGSDHKLAGNFSPASAGPAPRQTDSSGGGSGGGSPVVPLLIAVAALAALSIGVAIYRERVPLRR